MVQFPKGYLKKAYEIVRENGGLCVVDEVSGWGGGGGEEGGGRGGEERGRGEGTHCLVGSETSIIEAS